MPIFARNHTPSGRTFQEVMEQQAARQAGFGDVIPLQRFIPSSPSTDNLDLPSPPRRSHGVPSHPIAYPLPAVPHHHRPTQTAYPSKPGAASAIHLRPSTSFDQSRTSSSDSGASFRLGVPASATCHPHSSSSGISGISASTQTTTTTSSSDYQWSNTDWGHPDCPSKLSGDVPECKKKEGGLKAWLKRRTSKDRMKGKGKEQRVEVEAKPEEEKPVFIGGGRGGAQNRRIRAAPAPKKPSNLGSIPESHIRDSDRSSLAPSHVTSLTHSTSPLVTFTPDVQEALETLAPKPKAVFVGGGRGGMQNRKIRELLPSGASGSWKSGSGSGTAASISDTSSTRRSMMSVGSSVRDEFAGTGEAGGQGGAKPTFVGGGRGGAQNRRQRDTAVGSLAKKKPSRAVLGSGDLLTGIGVSTYTVTSSKAEGRVRS